MKSAWSSESFPRPSLLAESSLAGPAAAAHSLAGPTTLALLAIVAVASGLRFVLLGQQSLWADEAFVAWAVRFGWKDLFSVLATSDSHPPLYYALTKAWVGIAGTGEAALRFPSAVCSSLSVILTYALARRIASPTVSLLGALLVAVSPFDIMAAQEARMYPLLSLLAVGSTLALSLSVERGSARRLGVYVLLTTLMVYTHYLGFFIVFAHGVWVATWERHFLRPWLAAILAAAVLYAPWGGALVTRVGDVAQLGRSAANPVPYLTPDDVLALFAFGGSLFGTATYFAAGTSSGLAHFIVLVPFALVLGVGVTSWWTQGKALGLIGLPLAITLGLGAALALAKPVLWPRALSFLVPFYAILLARGIVETSQVAGRHRDRALVLLGAGLLACSAPVLSRHYFDPAARPYQWRTAAAWVAAQARPGDYFVYVGRGSADSFTYYFREPYPARTLVLRRDPRPTFTPASAQGLAARYHRIWLVMSTPFSPTHPVVKRQVLPAIDSAFQVAGGREFNRVWVYLLAPRNAR